MLQSVSSNQRRNSATEAAALSDLPSAELINIDALLAAARRQWRVALFAGILGIAGGCAYLVTAVPWYRATASLLVDKNQAAMVNQQLALNAGAFADEAAIQSEVELVRSQKIGLGVVDKFDLIHDRRLSASVSITMRVLSLLRQLADPTSWLSHKTASNGDGTDPRQAALAALNGSLTVERVPGTYVLNINFISPDRQFATQIAEAYANAYLDDKLQAKYDATKRASVWLSDRIAELRQQSVDSDLAVQKYRADNGLIAANGQLVSEQQLSEINTQLMTAQADTAQAKAKFNRVEAIIASGDPNAIVSGALDSAVINDLRGKYLEALKTENDLEKKVGPDHLQVVNLESEIAEYKTLMFGELARIGESYKSEYGVAQAREDALRRSLASSLDENSSANETSVNLRALEREADTYRNMYQTFMQRYQEALQQQSFPVTEARIIADAYAQPGAVKPRKGFDLALGLLLGLAVGGAIGAVREYRERFFRTGDQIRNELGLDFLGFLPAVKERPQKRAKFVDRQISDANALMRYGRLHPLSAFAETLRSVSVTADVALVGHRPKTIGVVSSLPGEGKSTVAANLAQLLASQGSRTLLVDGDLRNPDLTKNLAPTAERGLIEAIAQERPVDQLLWTDPESKLAFLPTAAKSPVSHSAQLLMSQETDTLLSSFGGQFDYIIVDLPPIAPVVDVKAFAPRVDAFVFVIEWGRTSRRVARSILDAQPVVLEKCLGAVLNKVDLTRLKLYRAYDAQDYTYADYSKYRAGDGV
jgi:succinoglycan biosynthesis transport protein ExoP